MNIKRAMMIVVLIIAGASIAVPLVGLNARAAGSAASSRMSAIKARPYSPMTRSSAQQVEVQQTTSAAASQDDAVAKGKISAETLKALGINSLPKGLTSKEAAQVLSKKITHGNPEVLVRTTLPPGTGPGGASPVPAVTGLYCFSCVGAVPCSNRGG